MTALRLIIYLATRASPRLDANSVRINATPSTLSARRRRRDVDEVAFGSFLLQHAWMTTIGRLRPVRS
jgi:hypothetical protein